MSPIQHTARNPLRRWRQQHGVTQAQLAGDMRVHPSVVSQWETGRSIPSLDKFDGLYRRTGIAVHDLLRFFVPPPASVRSTGVVVPFTRAAKGVST